MCFQMTQKVDRVEDPDIKEIFRVFDVGYQPSEDELLDQVKTAGKLWMANKTIGKVIEIAEVAGRKIQVTNTGDIPPILDRSVLFTSNEIYQGTTHIAHWEQTWATPDHRLDGLAIMLQLKDFSWVAQWSFGEPDSAEYPQYPVDSQELIRREVRIKFNLELTNSMIWEMPKEPQQYQLTRGGKVEIH